MGDPDYDEACAVYNGMIDKHPALVARCTDVADVVTAVNFARNQNLLLAVRGGGHNGAGLGTCDDGLVIDLSAMNSVHVDPEARTARVGGGSLWGDVEHATHLYGLATPTGIIQSMFDGLYPPGQQWYWRGDYVEEIPDAAIDKHIEFAKALPTPLSTMHMYPIDGAAGRVGARETPWAYRDAKWASVFAGVDPDPANAAKIREWCVSYHEALHPYSMGGSYINFMMNEGQERIRATYGQNYDRLVEAKNRYDPENLFQVNQNIIPTT